MLELVKVFCPCFIPSYIFGMHKESTWINDEVPVVFLCGQKEKKEEATSEGISPGYRRQDCPIYMHLLNGWSQVELLWVCE